MNTNIDADARLADEDEAFLKDIEALLSSDSAAPLPADLEEALRRQTRDRLRPERFSATEVVVLSLVGVVSLGVAGGHAWTPGQLAILVPALLAYCAATLVFASGDSRD